MATQRVWDTSVPDPYPFNQFANSLHTNLHPRPHHYTPRHKSHILPQINVAFANGSVRRGKKALFWNNLSKCLNPFSSGYNKYQLDTAVYPNTGVWADLDRAQ